LLDVIKGAPSAEGPLKGDPFRIILKGGAQNFGLATSRRVPIPLLPKVTAELHRMENAGIIESITNPTE